jgi:OPA family glycerol-3-phosphate transporter-like MFS transporter 1/2
LGTLVAAVYIETDWGLSFMLPGVIMGVLGFINFFLLVPNPMDAGYSLPTADGYQKISGANSSDEESADVGYHSQSTVENVSCL